MVFRTLWQCGAWTLGISGGLYVLTWILMASWPSRVLLGGVESLWLRCLVRAAYVGIAIILLGALDLTFADQALRRH